MLGSSVRSPIEGIRVVADWLWVLAGIAGAGWLAIHVGQYFGFLGLGIVGGGFLATHKAHKWLRLRARSNARRRFLAETIEARALPAHRETAQKSQ